MEMRQKSRPRARGHSEHLTAAPEMTEVPETTDGHTAVVPTCGLPATAHAHSRRRGPLSHLGQQMKAPGQQNRLLLFLSSPDPCPRSSGHFAFRCWSLCISYTLPSHQLSLLPLATHLTPGFEGLVNCNCSRVYYEEASWPGIPSIRRHGVRFTYVDLPGCLCGLEREPCPLVL